MRILIAEDDPGVLAGLLELLEGEGYKVESVRDGGAALEKKIEEFDLLLTDLYMPVMNGLDLLVEARQRAPHLSVILMTGQGSVPTAVEAMKKGALMYLTKPFAAEELLIHVREIGERIMLRRMALRGGRGGMVGTSGAMQEVYRLIDSASTVDATVLLTGETGTGKDLAAHRIHEQSARRHGPFIAVNLGALPRELVESELFGHEAGAFTGAGRRKAGRFALAAGGTLFLDEINSLPMELQSKLLRAIDAKEFWPLGAERAVRSDVRIVAATNRKLEEMVRQGSFREDLFFRLNVLGISLPPLREHPEDIPVIAQTLLERMAEEGGRKMDLSAAALARLIRFEWPGNVRQLGNVLEKTAALMAKERTIIAEEDIDLPSPTATAEANIPFKEARALASDEWAKHVIQDALTRTGGNVSEAARLLRVNRNALFRLIARYGIKRGI